MKNKILTVLNNFLKITNLFGGTPASNPTATLEGVPLGTVDDSPTGEIVVKIIIVE